MSDLYAHIAIEDARVEPLGVKETLAMALEHLGGVRVLSVELQGPEQLRMAGGAFAPPKQKPKPAPPSRGGQAQARRSPQPQTAMECCFSCARYCSGPGRDSDGKQYWGTCGRTGQPVYDLKNRCAAWKRLGG